MCVCVSEQRVNRPPSLWNKRMIRLKAVEVLKSWMMRSVDGGCPALHRIPWHGPHPTTKPRPSPHLLLSSYPLPAASAFSQHPPPLSLSAVWHHCLSRVETTVLLHHTKHRRECERWGEKGGGGGGCMVQISALSVKDSHSIFPLYFRFGLT